MYSVINGPDERLFIDGKYIAHIEWRFFDDPYVGYNGEYFSHEIVKAVYKWVNDHWWDRPRGRG